MDSPNTVDGQYIYRAGYGMGSVKDKLLTRVKIRKENTKLDKCYDLVR